MSSGLSPTETEVKIPWAGSAAEARLRIEERGYRLIESRTLESDRLFDHPAGELTASGKLLRLRQTTPQTSGSRPDAGAATDSDVTPARATVTYKGPGMSERYKSREEIEFDISDANRFVQMLDRLGYVPRFAYEKYRTKFSAQGEPGIVTMDETPIGVFLELEGPEYWIDSTATKLGFDHSAYSTASYAALYREYRAQNPGTPVNMVFKK